MNILTTLKGKTQLNESEFCKMELLCTVALQHNNNTCAKACITRIKLFPN